jgi:hypothetical protein
MAMMSTSLVTDGFVLSTYREGVLARSTSLSVVTSELHAAKYGWSRSLALGSRAVMRNSSTKEEKDTVGSFLCK